VTVYDDQTGSDHLVRFPPAGPYSYPLPMKGWDRIQRRWEGAGGAAPN